MIDLLLGLSALQNKLHDSNSKTECRTCKSIIAKNIEKCLHCGQSYPDRNFTAEDAKKEAEEQHKLNRRAAIKEAEEQHKLNRRAAIKEAEDQVAAKKRAAEKKAKAQYEETREAIKRAETQAFSQIWSQLTLGEKVEKKIGSVKKGVVIAGACVVIGAILTGGKNKNTQ